MSISKNEIKQICSLHQKKFRDESGLFIVEGEKMVSEAIASDFEVVKVYRREDIGDEAMDRISAFSSGSPVLAVVKRKKWDDPFNPDGLYIGLDSVRDPGNFGTIMRVADWYGIDGIYASKNCVELENPKTVQSTMGAIFRVKVIYCDLAETCDKFIRAGKNIYGTFLEGDNIYTSNLDTTGLIIMGNEANGISDAIAEKVSNRLTIPSFGGFAESLNVAMATGITVSEFKRRTLFV